MRFSAATFALTCLLLGACRTMPDLSTHPAPSAAAEAALVACPDGMPVQPGLTDFGAYIGTWQANHRRIPQTMDYAIASGSGRVGVRCSTSNYVIAESISLTFRAPSGRALQFALTDLPSDASKIYDHTHPACRSLQYRSETLSMQLPHDAHDGLVEITLRSSTGAYSLSAISRVDISLATARGDDSRTCPRR